MAIRTIHTLAIFAICCFLLAGFAGASTPISTINPGNTVFIGEQGLDITAAMQGDTQLGWWASGASISTSSPSQIVPVPDPSSFSVSPYQFGAYTGTWYHLSPAGKVNGSAFTVMDPQLDLRLEDTTVNVDVTDKWVPTGDDILFRIGTNLAAITQRPSVSSVPITIKVQSPSGGVYSALLNSQGYATTIVDIPVTSADYSTAPIWNTGVRDTYSPGTYTIWAVCNVNSMNNNYNQVGKTISQQVTLLNQDNNPLIVNPGYVTNPATPVITAVTPTVPATSVPTTPVTVITTPVTSATTPVTTITTSSTTTPSETIPPAATTPTTTPKSTMSPGFDGALVVLAAIVGMIACTKRN